MTIEEQDVFRVDLSKADVVVLYLLPWMLQDLIPQFDKMRPGARIVSHDFRIEGIEPERVDEVFVAEKNDTSYVIRYVTPLQRTPPKPAKPIAARRSWLGFVRGLHQVSPR